jgi:hypothetical protein
MAMRKEISKTDSQVSFTDSPRQRDHLIQNISVFAD